MQKKKRRAAEESKWNVSNSNNDRQNFKIIIIGFYYLFCKLKRLLYLIIISILNLYFDKVENYVRGAQGMEKFRNDWIRNRGIKFTSNHVTFVLSHNVSIQYFDQYGQDSKNITSFCFGQHAFYFEHKIDELLLPKITLALVTTKVLMTNGSSIFVSEFLASVLCVNQYSL